MIFKKIFLLHIYSQILENMQLLPVGIDKYCEMWYTMKVRRRDGIGRRARLKINDVISVVGRALISGFFRYSEVLAVVW